MDHLVLEDSLESFEPIATLNPGDGDRSLDGSEGLEQQRRGNGNRVRAELREVPASVLKRLTACLRHAGRDAELQTIGDQPLAVPSKKLLIVQIEEMLEIVLVQRELECRPVGVSELT
jgi:hypothetical protein